MVEKVEIPILRQQLKHSKALGIILSERWRLCQARPPQRTWHIVRIPKTQQLEAISVLHPLSFFVDILYLHSDHYHSFCSAQASLSQNKRGVAGLSLTLPWALVRSFCMGACRCEGSTWTPKVCKIMAIWAVFSGFGPLFYILWGSR